MPPPKPSISAEPLSSEDTALLSAVAGQVATALENNPTLRARELASVADEVLRVLDAPDPRFAMLETIRNIGEHVIPHFNGNG